MKKARLVFTVSSSAGQWACYADNGEVINKDQLYPIDNSLETLIRLVSFDVAEYRDHYGVKNLPATVDILDIGYNYSRGGKAGYEAPEADWRNEVALLRAKG